MPLSDAHCHLQVPELQAHWPQFWSTLPSYGIHRWMVNGMDEADWELVHTLAQTYPSIIPNFGLHPWQVPHRSAQWLELLEHHLQQSPRAGVGEFGLDHWMRGHDVADQLRVFRPQLALATKYQRPASIHCIQAWGLLEQELKAQPLPERGFLIHAYGGPPEMVATFVKLGAYFSFSPYFLNPAKASKRASFLKMPLDRILIETDAPALWPPLEQNPFPLEHPETGAPINHPANLHTAWRGLAALLKIDETELAEQLEANFNHWIG
jgi:TatD DNase family protein